MGLSIPLHPALTTNPRNRKILSVKLFQDDLIYVLILYTSEMCRLLICIKDGVTRGILWKPTPGGCSQASLCCWPPGREASIIFGRLLASPNRAGASLLLLQPCRASGLAWGTGGKSLIVDSCQPVIAQPCLTFCNPMDSSLPGSPVHGILQARILEWVATSSSRGSSWLRDKTCISCTSCIGRQILYHRTTWEAPELAKLSLTRCSPLKFISLESRLSKAIFSAVCSHSWPCMKYRLYIPWSIN